MVTHQFLDMFDLKRDADSDADSADRQDLDDAVDASRSVWSNPFQRRQPNHLGAVKEKMAGAALAGIHRELSDWLAQKLANGLALHLVSNIVGIDINDLARVLRHRRGQSGRSGDRKLAFGCFRFIRGDEHTWQAYLTSVRLSKCQWLL